MSIPGSYTTSGTDDSEDDTFSPATMAALMESTTDTDTMDENDFELDMDEGDTENEAFDPIDEDEDDRDAEEEDDQTDGGGAGRIGDAADRGGQIQIGFDPRTRQILLINSSGDATRLTRQHLAGSTLTLQTIRAMMMARFGGGGGNDDEDEDEDDEDDEDDEEDGGYWGPSRKKTKQWYEPITIPKEAGVNLERSGEFGTPPKKYGAEQRKFVDYSPNMAQVFRLREYDHKRTLKSTIGDFVVPNSSGTEVSNFQSKVYSGQYSHDGSFFYSACQDFNVYIYDTRTAPRTGSKSVTDTQPRARSRRGMGSFWQHRSSMKTIKVVKAHEMNCRWTITDANLSLDNEWLAYSSITPRVHLVKTGEGAGWDTDDHEQSTLDFAAGVRGSSSFGIWSVRFSNDAKELVAGANDGQIFVYDIESRRTILRVNAHKDDVNAVAFADSASSNLILSGSDDKFVKVWDRRSLSGARASGTLVGHTEGITFVAPKGDGRYCLSNGKDQGLKLWDLRMMVSDETFDRLRLDQVDYGIPGWDYRQAYYAKPKTLEHPNDCSVMTYRGHAVLRTLIRCHFSPIATTNQRYVYSGSSDGKIHIWSLDGRIVQTLDRRNTHPLINQETGEYNDPSAIDLRRTDAPTQGSVGSAVRDVSWHPSEASLMSTAWEGRDGIEGSIAKHEWKGLGGSAETMEDQVEREIQESSG